MELDYKEVGNDEFGIGNRMCESAKERIVRSKVNKCWIIKMESERRSHKEEEDYWLGNVVRGKYVLGVDAGDCYEEEWGEERCYDFKWGEERCCSEEWSKKVKKHVLFRNQVENSLQQTIF